MDKIFKVFDKTVFGITIFLYFSFVVMAFAQVIFRFVLNNSIVWAEEYCRYAFIWMVMITSAIAIGRRSHMSIDIVKNLIPKKLKKLFDLFIDVIVFVFLCFLAYVGFELSGKTMLQASPAMRIPIGYAYAAVPVGSIVMIVYIVRRAFVDFRKVVTEVGGDC